MKAIVIVDIDDELLKEYEDFAVEYVLIATSKEDPLRRRCVRYVGETKSKLKPIPERKYAIQGMRGYQGTARECKGWNACLDEIIGEE